MMVGALQATEAGLAIVDRARQRRGWTKISTPRWWQDAHTSRATLRRFWQQERIQPEIFIAICESVGITDWKTIAAPSELEVPDQETPILVSQDWDDAPEVELFYGRERELALLQQWIETEQCKLVILTGLVGTGKTALCLTLAERVQANFDRLIWRSLQTTPKLPQLLRSLVELPNDQDLQQGISLLLKELRQQRSLLVLDGLEAVNSELQDYTELLQRLCQERHQSCIVITSRENPLELEIARARAVKSLAIAGLPQASALELLKTRGISEQVLGVRALIQLYGGNPLALKLATNLIQTVFGGNVAAFIGQNTIVLGDRLQQLLRQQLDRLTPLEWDILYWLVIWQEPISFCRLQTHHFGLSDPMALLEGVAALERRALLEKHFIADEPAFTLPSLLRALVTEILIEQVVQEFKQVVQSKPVPTFNILKTHWLLRPGTDDLSGDRLLLQLRERLWQEYGAPFREILHQLIILLQGQPPRAIGYAGCNLAALLKIW